MTKKKENVEKWNLKSIDDSLFSLFLASLTAKSLLSWQNNTVVPNCTFLFKPENLYHGSESNLWTRVELEFVTIFNNFNNICYNNLKGISNFKIKLINFLNFNPSQYFWLNRLFRLSIIINLNVNSPMANGGGGGGWMSQVFPNFLGNGKSFSFKLNFYL